MTKILHQPEEHEKATNFPYDSLVGSLLWMTQTRLEILYAVAQCAQFNRCHTKKHDKAALKILGYLKKFPSLGIIFRRPEILTPPLQPLKIEIHSDLSYADNTSNRKSSYSFYISVNKNVIAWVAKKTPNCAVSEEEAERVRGEECARI